MSEKLHDRLDSWKAIAEYLDRDTTTVMRWARERGLPVYSVPGEGQRRRAVYAYKSEIDAWLRKLPNRGPVIGQDDRDADAARAGVAPAGMPDESTAPLATAGSASTSETPARSLTLEGGTAQTAAASASTTETASRPLSEEAASPQAAGEPVGAANALGLSPSPRAGPGPGIPDSRIPPASHLGTGPGPGVPDSRLQIPRPSSSPTFRVGTRRSLLAVSLAGAVLIAVAALAWLRVPAPQPKVLRFEQLTNDGLEKPEAIVTDGARVYFVELSGGGCVIAEIPTSGGNPVAIAKVESDSNVQDVSPDRSELLLIQGARLKPGSVWVLPLLAGSLRRLGTIQAFSAAWSPDGAALAYTTDDGLYLCDANGSNSRRIVAISGRLEGVHWSPDGRQLCLTRFSPKETTFWVVDRDGKGLRRLFTNSEMPEGEAGGFWTPEGRYLVFQAVYAGHCAPWAMRLSAGLLKRNGQPTCLGPAAVDIGAAAMSSDRSRLYCVARAKWHYQIERLDARSRQFVPFLPDVHAGALDFTRDGGWVAYTDDDSRLWKCRSDGGHKIQLTLPPVDVQMPRWSPDGKWIAFMGQDPGRPWKVRVVSAEGGPYDPVTSTDAAEGAPTWSPDGSRLVFGGLVDPRTRTPGPLLIHFFDLKERRLSVVPGSEGLWTARWSPDGRHIAALTEDSRSLVLFDFHTTKWTKLLTLGQIWDLHWSRQGESLYLEAVPPGEEGALFRVKIPGHQPARLTGMGNTVFSAWLGLAPDDSPLVVRQVSGEEIYALECQFP